MKLNAAARKALPQSDFALPGGHYPIEDQGHAQAALSEASQHASPAQQSIIRQKVRSRYPDMLVKPPRIAGMR